MEPSLNIAKIGLSALLLAAACSSPKDDVALGGQALGEGPPSPMPAQAQVAQRKEKTLVARAFSEAPPPGRAPSPMVPTYPAKDNGLRSFKSPEDSGQGSPELKKEKSFIAPAKSSEEAVTLSAAEYQKRTSLYLAEWARKVKQGEVIDGSPSGESAKHELKVRFLRGAQ